MGVPKGSKEHEQAIATILEATHAAGKKCGIFPMGGAAAKQRAEQGFDMVRLLMYLVSVEFIDSSDPSTTFIFQVRLSSDTACITNGFAEELAEAQGITDPDQVAQLLKQYAL
jgi:hypothetical protein